jgi:hypothetical protein
MVPTKLLIMASLPHDGYHSLFFKAVEVDATSLLSFSSLVELYKWSSQR